MAFPPTMTDEQLVVFGFEVLPGNPRQARSKLYPNLSFRHRCDGCGQWTTLTGNAERMLCKYCFIGKKPRQPTKDFLRLYECCGDRECSTWLSIVRLFRASGIEPNYCYGGYGGYTEINFPLSWTSEQRIAFHLRLNEFCIVNRGSRQVVCDSSGLRGSKLPKPR